MTAVPPDIALLGFTSVHAFQRAWNLGMPLVVDDIAGPRTRSAANRSAIRHREGSPDLSLNFSAREFACKCGGKDTGCQRVVVLRELLVSLEQHRKHIGGQAVHILDGYRCPVHNREVGGATDSQHLYGAAADLVGAPHLSVVQPWDLYAGIGFKARTKVVEHVDRRDISGHNLTSGTLTHPTVWKYS